MATPILICYKDPSNLNLALGLFLIFGTFISYIPQYWSIIKLRSSAGLSWEMLAIALESSYLTAINSIILKWSQATCCKDLDAGECLKNNLATEQLAVGLFSYLMLYILYLAFFDTPGDWMERLKISIKKMSWGGFILVNINSVALGVAALIMYYELGFRAEHVKMYARVLGIISSILMVLMYAPQIYTTWKLQNAGSLSLAMLLLQFPGALLVVLFQGFFQDADFTTWVPYVFLAIAQFILISMLAWFFVRDWLTNRAKEKDPEKKWLLDVTPEDSERFEGGGSSKSLFE